MHTHPPAGPPRTLTNATSAYAPPKHALKAGLFYISGVITTGAFTYVIAIGQLATILGPLLALKGPDGSMERALRKPRASLPKPAHSNDDVAHSNDGALQ